MSGTWASFVQKTISDERQHEVAQRSGINQATISRWLTNRERVPSASNVVRFARAYGINPLEALVAAGVISESEAELRERSVDLSLIPSAQLARELARRADESAA